MDSTHNDDGWVTDQTAIDTVIALGELKVGDEIILQMTHNIFIRDPDGTICRITGLSHTGWDHPWRESWEKEESTTRPVLCHVETAENSWAAVRENIAAWRRPCPSK